MMAALRLASLKPAKSSATEGAAHYSGMAIPVAPIAYKPVDCPVIVAPAALPAVSAPVIQLSQDLVSYTLRQSNVTVDLNGHRIGTLVVSDGCSRVRITNGRIGNIDMAKASSSDLPLRVFDITIDHVQFVGGVTNRNGNGFRVGRMLIANCTSIAASGRDTKDGMNTCIAWLDGGSADVMIQDCDLRTYGVEATLRFESAKRTITHHSILGVTTEKHCFRLHGNARGVNGVGEDHWISDCTLVNRGTMIFTLPDSVGPEIDRGRRVWMKRLTINMNMDGQGGEEAGFNLPTARLSDGTYHLTDLVVEDITLSTRGTYNSFPTIERFATSTPAARWSVKNLKFVKLP